MNFKILKKLAKSNKWQIIYSKCKDLGTLRLFKNDVELAKIQVWFLYFLEIYSSLYTDLAMGEKYISDEVIDDSIRCEAYLFLRSKMRKEKNYGDKNSDKITPNNIPTVIFKRKNKEVK